MNTTGTLHQNNQYFLIIFFFTAKHDRKDKSISVVFTLKKNQKLKIKANNRDIKVRPLQM